MNIATTPAFPYCKRTDKSDCSYHKDNHRSTNNECFGVGCLGVGCFGVCGVGCLGFGCLGIGFVALLAANISGRFEWSKDLAHHSRISYDLFNVEVPMYRGNSRTSLKRLKKNRGGLEAGLNRSRGRRVAAASAGRGAPAHQRATPRLDFNRGGFELG